MDEGNERTRWSLDHLFIDGAGIPALVEVKRPTVRGQTAAVPRTKGSSERRTRDEFEEMLRAKHGDAAVSAVEELVEAASELGSYLT